ncbi:hypothetical protein BKA82DRAFT_4017104 [Pisolithus tinctorius]|nr:hypothetical protein BKA82DRAFT_4017104 [Pisolithus tinctorius]
MCTARASQPVDWPVQKMLHPLKLIVRPIDGIMHLLEHMGRPDATMADDTATHGQARPRSSNLMGRPMGKISDEVTSKGRPVEGARDVYSGLDHKAWKGPSTGCAIQQMNWGGPSGVYWMPSQPNDGAVHWMLHPMDLMRRTIMYISNGVATHGRACGRVQHSWEHMSGPVMCTSDGVSTHGWARKWDLPCD